MSQELKLHPDLIWATKGAALRKKELHYFDRTEVVGRTQEARAKSIKSYNGWFKRPLPTTEARYIEATPSYFYDAGHTIRNIVQAYGANRFKQLSFVAMFRNPVDRHVSYFNHFKYVTRKKPPVIKDDDLNAWTARMMRLPPATGCASGRALSCDNRLMLGAYAHWYANLTLILSDSIPHVFISQRDA